MKHRQGGIRTPNPWIWNPPLYQLELLALSSLPSQAVLPALVFFDKGKLGFMFVALQKNSWQPHAIRQSKAGNSNGELKRRQLAEG